VWCWGGGMVCWETGRVYRQTELAWLGAEVKGISSSDGGPEQQPEPQKYLGYSASLSPIAQCEIEILRSHNFIQHFTPSDCLHVSSILCACILRENETLLHFGLSSVCHVHVNRYSS
jgi:hypothetical protein